MRADPCQWENEWPRNSMVTAQAVLASGEDVDLRSLLPSITAPTLVLHGDADIIPLGGSEAYVSGIPNARLLRLPGVGHYPPQEAPDVLFPAIDSFLRG